MDAHPLSMAAETCIVTVREAAAEVGVSVRTVQNDIAKGGDFVARPGEPGRGRGALIDLAAYRAHRSGQTDDRRAFWLAACRSAAAALREVKTAAARRAAAFALLDALERLHSEIFRAQLDELPDECAALFRVSLLSSRHD